MTKETFHSKARPLALWVSVVSLLYAGVIYPIMLWLVFLIQLVGVSIPTGLMIPPNMDAGLLGVITAALAALGAMRSYDKKEGTNSDKLE